MDGGARLEEDVEDVSLREVGTRVEVEDGRELANGHGYGEMSVAGMQNNAGPLGEQEVGYGVPGWC